MTCFLLRILSTIAIVSVSSGLYMHSLVQADTVLNTSLSTQSSDAIQGVIAPRARVKIYALVAGVVEFLPWNIGEHVKQNDVIARVEPSVFRVLVKQAEADLLAAKSRLEVTKVDLQEAGDNRNRMQLLEKRQLVSVQEMATNRYAVSRHSAQLEQAQAQAHVSEAELQAARLMLSRTEVKAPFSGRIAKRITAQGEYVTEGAELLEIVTDNIEIRLYLPASFSNRLQKHNCLSVRYGEENSDKITATIQSIAPEIDNTGYLAAIAIPIAPISISQLDVPFGSQVQLTTIDDCVPSRLETSRSSD